MNQRFRATNRPPNLPIIENPVPPPQGNPPGYIGTPDDASPATLNPPIIEIDDHKDAFFILGVASLYEAFGPMTDEVEKKVKDI